MWICTNQGFISIVQDAKNPDVIKVRARKREHLAALFPGEEIVETHNTDYQFRVITNRTVVAALLADLVLNPGAHPASVDYTNFKASVGDARLHDLYADFWSLHYRYQPEPAKKPTGARDPFLTGAARALKASDDAGFTAPKRLTAAAREKVDAFKAKDQVRAHAARGTRWK